jgi:putative transcriptional regulator
MESINSLANHLLIAMPNLEDSFFSRSVTYICEHTEEGALGIMLSQPLEATYHELFDHLKISSTNQDVLDNALLAGGPVDKERGFILHSPLGSWNSSLTISDDIALSTSEDILAAIANREGPDEAVIALGYSGWDKGQLEQEIEENSWLIVPADKNIIFHTEPQKRWQQATKLLGIDWTQLTEHSGHA